MDRSSTKVNWIATLAIGSAAAAFAVSTLIVRWVSRNSKATLQPTPTKDSVKPKTNSCASPAADTSTMYREVAESHVVRLSSSVSEWVDEQIGIRMQFSPSTLRLVHESRHHPVVLLKFISCKEPETCVQCIIEDLGETMPAEEYRALSMEKIKDVVKVSRSSSIRVGTDVHPHTEYTYLTDAESIINVISVFSTHERVGVAMQHCTPNPLPKTLPAAFHELIRTTKFFPVKPSPSYLFCAEPRLGVGFRVPLDFCLSTSGALSENTLGGDGSGEGAAPFATLASAHSGITVVARSERNTQSMTDLVEQSLKQCFERFALHDRPRIVFHGDQTVGVTDTTLVMRPCSIAVPTADVDFGWAGPDAESSSRTISGCFCFHEVTVDASQSRDIGFEHFESNAMAYFCVYILAIGVGEHVSVAFLSPRSHDLQSFVQFCRSVIHSISLGNHYGQDTSLTYCNMKHLCKFHVNVSNQLNVREPRFGDPLCLIKCQGVTDTVVSIRIIPCADTSPALDTFENEILHLIEQLGGSPRILERVKAPLLSIGGTLIFVVHEHDYSTLDTSISENEYCDNLLQNPFAQCDDDDDLFEPISMWATAVVCVNSRAYIFQTISSPYCFPASRSSLSEIITGFSPFAP